MDGQELRQRRDALVLSQAKLAVRLGVPRITIYRWEKGQAIKHGAMLALALRWLEHERDRGRGEGVG